MRLAWTLLAALALAGCGEKPLALDEQRTVEVRLPNGKRILAELLTHPTDMMRGMMFRDSLPEGRGMLFAHGQAGRYQYWMYQVKVPLDIVWLDAGRRIVEISADTPPCQTKASECPRYGGNQEALFVLELAAGAAARNGLRPGDLLAF